MTFITGDVEKLYTAWPFLPPLPQDTPESAIDRIMDATVVLTLPSTCIYEQSDTQFVEVRLKSIVGYVAVFEVNVSGTNTPDILEAEVVYGDEYSIAESVVRCSGGSALNMTSLDLVLHPACIILENAPLTDFVFEVPSAVNVDGTIGGYTQVSLIGTTTDSEGNTISGIVLKPGNNTDVAIAGGSPSITVLPGKGKGLVENPEDVYSECPPLARHPTWGLRTINGVSGSVSIRGVSPIKIDTSIEEGSGAIVLKISADAPENQ